MLTKTILLIILPLCLTNPIDVTFKNVTFRGYSFFVVKFNRIISSSNSLKQFLPKSPFDKIVFSEQHIPVLYENSLADLGDLNELAIEFCQVDEIRPGALKNVPLLRTFSLRGNKLREVKKGVFNNLSLLILDLNSNFIITIDSGAFDDLPNMSSIYLRDNLIAKWDPEWFKNTSCLATIFMQNNSISKLPNGAFKNLKGYNKFDKVERGVNIFLSDNEIKLIERYAFKNSPKINSLWLDSNQLEDFDENLLNNVEVNELWLSNNNISCFDGDLAKIFKANTTDIDGNPLDCECVGRMQTWAKENNKNVFSFSSVLTCSMHQLVDKLTELENALKEHGGKDKKIVVTEGSLQTTPTT